MDREGEGRENKMSRYYRVCVELYFIGEQELTCETQSARTTLQHTYLYNLSCRVQCGSQAMSSHLPVIATELKHQRVAQCYKFIVHIQTIMVCVLALCHVQNVRYALQHWKEKLCELQDQFPVHCFGFRLHTLAIYVISCAFKSSTISHSKNILFNSENSYIP